MAMSISNYSLRKSPNRFKLSKKSTYNHYTITPFLKGEGDSHDIIISMKIYINFIIFIIITFILNLYCFTDLHLMNKSYKKEMALLKPYDSFIIEVNNKFENQFKIALQSFNQEENVIIKKQILHQLIVKTTKSFFDYNYKLISITPFAPLLSPYYVAFTLLGIKPPLNCQKTDWERCILTVKKTSPSLNDFDIIKNRYEIYHKKAKNMILLVKNNTTFL